MVSTPEALSSLLLTPTRSPLKSNQTQYLKIIRTPFIAAEFLEVFKAGPIGDACLKGGISTEFLFSTTFLSWFLSPVVFAPAVLNQISDATAWAVGSNSASLSARGTPESKSTHPLSLYRSSFWNNFAVFLFLCE